MFRAICAPIIGGNFVGGGKDEGGGEVFIFVLYIINSL